MSALTDSIAKVDSITLYYTCEDGIGFIEQYEFSVKREWLVDYLGGIDAVASFLDEYTSDDSMAIYDDAYFDDAIVSDAVCVN